MSSGLTDDDKRRIESFCETPPYDRSPEDLTPEQQYADDVRMADGESEGSLMSAFLNRLRNR
jgi:hypothetical protein